MIKKNMYVSKKDLKALCEAQGQIAHESNCRGDMEMDKIAGQLEQIIEKAKNDIRRRKCK